MRREVRLGIFFLLATAAVGVVTLTVGQWTPPWVRTTRLTVIFPDAGGLRRGDPVRIAGVACGRVESVALEGAQARVTLSLDQRPTLREDYAIAVQAPGLGGGRAVEVFPGSPTKAAVDLERPLKGAAAPSPVQELAQVLQENREDVRKTLKNMEEITGSVREVTGAVRRLMRWVGIKGEAESAAKGAKE